MKDIEYVVTVAQYKSISKAAELLYLSQPSLSRYINKLEEKLGVRLFDRNHGGISLTEAGKIYVEYGKQILELNNTLEAKMRNLRMDSEKNIRIGMTLNASYMSSRKMNRLLNEKYPECSLTISNIRSLDIAKVLRSGECDFVIGPDFREDNEDFAKEATTEEYLLLLVPERWDLSELAERREGLPYPWIDLRKIKDTVDFIIQDSTSAVRWDLDDVLKKYGIELKASMNTINSTLAIQAAEAQLGCCFVSETFLPYTPNPEYFRQYCVGDPVKRTYSYLMYLKDAQLSKEKRYCMSIVKQIVAEDYRRIADMAQNNF